MTKTIKDIVKEELAKLIESIADTAAERMFNIPDPNAEMEKIAMSGIKDTSKDNSMGTFVGIMEDNNVDINIYLNPKNLKNFERNVKAISTKNGDLFVEQIDGQNYHQDMIVAINSDGVYNKGLYNAYDEEYNVTWHRINDTNNFGFSVSYRDFSENPRNKPVMDIFLQTVKQKNPNFNFIPRYWQYIRQEHFPKTNINTTTPPPRSVPIFSNR